MATDLNALEAVLAKATPGQWQQDPIGDYYIRDGAGNVVIRCDQNETRDLMIALHNAAPALIAEHRALLAENTALRSALANSPGACVYCQLPANEMNRCAFGFPGCGRADDMQGCPHFGTSEIPEDIQEQHVALLARVEALEGGLRHIDGYSGSNHRITELANETLALEEKP